MRMRVIIETDYDGKARTFRDELRVALTKGHLGRIIPGEIVYVATDIADTAVVSHDGKTITVG